MTKKIMSGSGSSRGSSRGSLTPLGPLSLKKNETLYEVVRNRNVEAKKQPLITKQLKKQEKEIVDKIVTDYFYTTGIPFNVCRNEAFLVMCEAIGRYGWGYTPPTIHQLHGKLLDKHVANVDQLKAAHEIAWKSEGCTLMSNGWTNKRGRSLINFMVNSSEGSFYMYSIDASANEKTTDYIFSTLCNESNRC